MAKLKPNEVRLKKIDSELKTSYYNENDVFLAVVDNYDLIIYHKKTGSKVLIESFTKENWFLKEFASYCMGKEGIVIQDLNSD